mgnify:CR=1 FL=1
MANANTTLSRGISKPEKLAQWLFNNAGQFRNLLAFLLITALTVISIKFNIELGKLSAVDETSKDLLPAGYALLDLSALFLSGYVGLKSRSTARKITAWCWFIFLLCLSLWAAASFTLSIDARANSADISHAIDQKRLELDNLNAEVKIWRDNVANAVRFKSKHQKTLNHIQEKQLIAADQLHVLESSLPSPTMAIYEISAPVVGMSAEALHTLVRLLWAGALTLSPIVIMLLVGAELSSKEPEPSQQKKPEVTTNRATKPIELTHLPAAQGHNQYTAIEILNGLKHCREYLLRLEAGRVTRSKLGAVAQLKSRETITKIIDALMGEGLLERAGNGQLIRPVQVGLKLIK